mmetsp:Transcript_19301/g.32881  ORF Transcript_19301/g.32881 Transcript_19301/m.32881 type:complete len:141 (+) Transcript_19301:75-497(+)
MPFEVIGDKALSTQDHLFKLIIIGDTGVGKSCLMKRVMDNEFKQEHQVTIGVEFGSFGLKINNQVIKLQIWDTAGQERYDALTKMYFKGAEAAIVVYDVTDDQSFEKAQKWLRELEETKDSESTEIVTFLVGNKIDCVSE